MKEKYIKKEEFKTNTWDGGETRELFIYPPGSSLDERDFDFRISSASFTKEESDFSDFTGYRRYITSLQGSLYLNHDKLYERDLAPYELESFRGNWKTRSKNSLDCIDYNFIVKEDKRAIVQILHQGDRFDLKPGLLVSVYTRQDLDFAIGEEDKNLEANSLYLLETRSHTHIEIKKSTIPTIITIYVL